MSFRTEPSTGVLPVSFKQTVRTIRDKLESKIKLTPAIKLTSVINNQSLNFLPPLRALFSSKTFSPTSASTELIKKTYGLGSHFTKLAIELMETGKILTEQQIDLIKKYDLFSSSAITQVWNQHKRNHPKLSNVHWKLLKRDNHLHDLALKMFRDCPLCGK